MSIEVILLGCVLGFIITIFTKLSARGKPSPRTHAQTLPLWMTRSSPYRLTRLPRRIEHNISFLNPSAYSRPHFDDLLGARWLWNRTSFNPRLPPTIDMLPSIRDMKPEVQSWRKGIDGLYRLASENLLSAKSLLRNGHLEEAKKAALTSVENISRALIYCCGGKPDLCTRQEETLKLLVYRFVGKEKAELKKAIELIQTLSPHKTTSADLTSENGRIHESLCNRRHAKSVLSTASKVTKILGRIIITHFSEEIPELRQIKMSPNLRFEGQT